MTEQAKRGELQAWAQTAVHYSGNDCLLWPFKSKMSSGYGTIKSTGRTNVGVHRLVCELAHGAPPESNLQAAHSCGVKLCCNPKHLRWATSSENDADKDMHGTRNTGSKNGAAKLSEFDVAQIRRQSCNGTTGRELARRYSMSPASISLIINGHNWASI